MLVAKPPHPLKNESFNLWKQAKVVEFCSSGATMLPTLHVLSASDFDRAHKPGRYSDIMKRKAANGFGTADSLINLHALQSCQAMYDAARAAVVNKTVAFAPASGFHHAGWGYSGGYCTFNGLMVAALKLIADGMIKTVMIIDGDGHYGDGTQDIIDHFDLSGPITHVSLDTNSVGGEPDYASDMIDHVFGYPAPDLVLYQAGADAHIEDPYRAGYLNDSQWVVRDMQVFRWCAANGVPVAWNLAGGYNGLKTLNLHSRTFAAALQVYEPERSPLISALGGLSVQAESPRPAP
jgi:acetoin utilization deacetylase AcuC-like enzyme